MCDDPRVAIVGGGPAGLASAVALARHGVRATVFEEGDTVAHAWRTRYDRLRLNTSRLTSRVLGRSYGEGTALFPSRDEFVSYLERLAATEGVDVRLGTRVHRLNRGNGAWTLETAVGDLHSPEVIVATGYANLPFLPHWPGRAEFTRPIIHSADYRSPAPFADQDVLVVGAGSSGMEIAHDLADGGARRVRLATRTPPNIVLRSVAGMPGDLVGISLLRLPTRLADALDRSARRLLLGNLSDRGLPCPNEGTFARLRRLGVGPAVVDRETIRAVKDGRIEIVAGVASLDRTGVALTDGSRIEPDSVMAATGYGCGLVPLAGHLGVLDPRGVPRRTGGREAVPGLRFVGFVPVPGQIRRISVEARRAAREIARAGTVRAGARREGETWRAAPAAERPLAPREQRRAHMEASRQGVSGSERSREAIEERKAQEAVEERKSHEAAERGAADRAVSEGGAANTAAEALTGDGAANTAASAAPEIASAPKNVAEAAADTTKSVSSDVADTTKSVIGRDQPEDSGDPAS